MNDRPVWHRDSWLVNAGRPTEPGAPLNVPLVPASNFIIGQGREYSRDDGTPTWEALEALVGGLESGKSVAFSSGMAAIAAVFDLLPVGSLRDELQGTDVIACAPDRGSSTRELSRAARRLRLE